MGERETSEAYAGAPGAGALRRAPSRRRIWLFRFIAVFVIPALVLGVAELALRLIGAGYDPGYFTRMEDGRLCGNPAFGWRFFPRDIARMPPPFAIAEPKPAGTYRIFVLGSSAAQGFPDPSYSFGRILEAMLREAFPEGRIEVVNTAMVAVDSHVILPIAQDCADHEPDLLIVYEGNNEVVGPFGPGTVFAAFSERLWAIRLQLAISRLRFVQVIQRAAEGLRPKGEAPSEWKGMQFFLDRPVTAEDPRLESVHRHFERNLLDICRAGSDAGARVILCTVGVNLRDCAPFLSVHAPTLGADASRAWDGLRDEADALREAGDFEGALAKLRAAAELDDAPAELHYRMGLCEAASGRGEEARAELEKARDLDALRFRTDSRLNAIVRDAAETAGSDAVLVDVEKEMARVRPIGGPGAESFCDHCHMTFAGNYVIAAALFESVVPLLPEAVRGGHPPPDAPPSLERCAERLGFTPFGEYSTLMTLQPLLEHPPFSGAMDSRTRLDALKARVAELKTMGTGAAMGQWSERFENALRLAPDDAVLHRNYAELLALRGMSAEAAGHLDAALDQWPFDAVIESRLAGMLVQMGRNQDGVRKYRDVMRSKYCDPPCQAGALYNLGVIAQQNGRGDDARSLYEQSLAVRPRAEAHTNLAQVLMAQGQQEAGLAHLRDAVELAPENPTWHLNLAGALMTAGQSAAAADELRAALESEPDQPAVRIELIKLQQALGRHADAVATAEAGLTIAPESADLHALAAASLLELDRTADATRHLDEALRIEPAHAGALATRAGMGQPAR